MAEVNVVKQPKQERTGISRLPGFDTSLFGGSLFSMNPFALMRQLTEDMDRMFSQMPRGAVEGGVWSPLMEVKEKEGKLLVTAELPGPEKGRCEGPHRRRHAGGGGRTKAGEGREG